MTSKREELGSPLADAYCGTCGQEMRYLLTNDISEGQIAVSFCPDDPDGEHYRIEFCKGPKCRKPLFWVKTSDGRARPVDAESGLHHYQACHDVEGVRTAQVLEQQRKASAPQKGRRGGYGYGGVSRSRRPR